ncbi:LIM domain kinase 1 like protein [Verticillium longisporum]|nr:LIM domain kinase 1 like protein [Verticillium longisporum]
MASDQSLRIYESSEAFVEKDGDWVFHSTKVIIEQGGQYFSASIPKRRPQLAATTDLDRLCKTVIPPEDIWPLYEPGISILTGSPTAEQFCKRPSLIHYGDTEASLHPGRELLKEAKVCEILKQQPHPNVAAYFGCIVEGGRIKGLVFQKYAMTLSQRLRIPKPLDGTRCIRDIEEGLRHLHSLGLIHNDLNPSNIMVDDNDGVVITDFDSCEHEGMELGPKTCTPGWELTSKLAVPDNDYSNLSRLRNLVVDCPLSVEDPSERYPVLKSQALTRTWMGPEAMICTFLTCGRLIRQGREI